MEAGRGGWFRDRVGRWYSNDREKTGEHAGNVFAIVVVALVTIYFVWSQLDKTGFFASSFGSLEMVLFYLPVPLGIGVSLVKLATGRKNPSRPLDALNAAVIALACLWFFVVFPLDFAHLGDLLPFGLKVLVNWIPNSVVRVILVVGGLGSFFNVFYTSLIYVTVRAEYSRRATP
jgi:hypothetical protein